MAEASSNSTSELNTVTSIKQPGNGSPTANAVEQETNEASSILAAVSSKFDWILFVEGPTDKHFYEKIIFQDSEGSYNRDILETALKETEELKKSLERADEFKKVYTMVDDWQKSAQAMYSNPALYLNDFWGKTKSLCMDLLSDDDMTETLGIKKDYDKNKDPHATIFLYERVVPFYKKYLASLKDKGFNDRFSRDLLKKISKETWNADYVEHEGAKSIKKKLETKWSEEIGSAKKSLKSLISILNKKKANSIILESANKLKVDLGKLQISANSEEVLNESDILEESLKCFKFLKTEEDEGIKLKIYNLLRFKKEICEKTGDTPHFYGITDRDYVKDDVEDDGNSLRNVFLQKEWLMETDAHSLETMLIKYAEKDSGNYLLKVFLNINSSHCLTPTEAGSIYRASKEFALKIGRIRKEYGMKYNYQEALSKTDNYSAVIDLIGNGAFHFDEDKYINEGLNVSASTQSDKFNEIKDIMNRQEDGDKAFYICQGHDFVCFIIAMFSKLQNPSWNTGKSIISLTYDFIDAFNIGWFEESPLYEWLKKIEQDQQDEIKQKGINQSNEEEYKYTNMIINVGL